MIIHNLYWIICAHIPLSSSFPRSFCRSGFCEINLHFFHTNLCFKPLIVTLATPRVVPVIRTKVFIWRKVVWPACLPVVWGYPSAEVRQFSHPSCLTPPPPLLPRDNSETFIWMFLFFFNVATTQGKANSPRTWPGGSVVSGTRNHVNGPKSLLSIQLYSSTKLISENELEAKIRYT